MGRYSVDIKTCGELDARNGTAVSSQVWPLDVVCDAPYTGQSSVETLSTRGKGILLIRIHLHQPASHPRLCAFSLTLSPYNWPVSSPNNAQSISSPHNTPSTVPIAQANRHLSHPSNANRPRPAPCQIVLPKAAKNQQCRSRSFDVHAPLSPQTQVHQ
ncbi:hypothetical protein K458DRAFT_89169 [Lentithecium fluviatile CBS 122367]|uniref:Uncharacterized protein n=1 Tax=Lentithecium fluviatile CBS 122367 TaxID=1168545 RepID=A0A6G1IRL3_9PLEO|nr:hypothetical protein K458DRAFT_89169 [Lentithecium fluviatile CBS 122367]